MAGRGAQGGCGDARRCGRSGWRVALLAVVLGAASMSPLSSRLLGARRRQGGRSFPRPGSRAACWRRFRARRRTLASRWGPTGRAKKGSRCSPVTLDGTEWTTLPTPNPTGAAASCLQGVSCTSASACVAVGQFSRGKTWATLAEGWERAQVDNPIHPRVRGRGNRVLDGVSCTSARRCIAVGNIDRCFEPRCAMLPLAERWNGQKWAILPILLTPQGRRPGRVSCPSRSICSAVGLSRSRGDSNRWPALARWELEDPADPLPPHSANSSRSR